MFNMKRCRSRKKGVSLAAVFFVLIFIFATLGILHIGLNGDNKAKIPKNGTIVEIAESQIGNRSGRTYWSWYGFDEPVDWCACFVSWCVNKCGQIETKKAPKFSDCQDGVHWFVSNKAWHEQKITPHQGMIIFFDWDGNRKADHVGIVKSCKDGIVNTIEGNSEAQCRERSYALGDDMIYGYGEIGRLNSMRLN